MTAVNLSRVHCDYVNERAKNENLDITVYNQD